MHNPISTLSHGIIHSCYLRVVQTGQKMPTSFALVVSNFLVNILILFRARPRPLAEQKPF